MTRRRRIFRKKNPNESQKEAETTVIESNHHYQVGSLPCGSLLCVDHEYECLTSKPSPALTEPVPVPVPVESTPPLPV